MSKRFSSSSVFTSTGSPTSPSAASICVHRSKLSSFPESPMADPPASPISRTVRLFNCQEIKVENKTGDHDDTLIHEHEEIDNAK